MTKSTDLRCRATLATFDRTEQMCNNVGFPMADHDWLGIRRVSMSLSLHASMFARLAWSGASMFERRGPRCRETFP
eukprot:4368313-Pyramimonas_sp.AAC.1